MSPRSSGRLSGSRSSSFRGAVIVSFLIARCDAGLSLAVGESGLAMAAVVLAAIGSFKAGILSSIIARHGEQGHCVVRRLSLPAKDQPFAERKVTKRVFRDVTTEFCRHALQLSCLLQPHFGSSYVVRL